MSTSLRPEDLPGSLFTLGYPYHLTEYAKLPLKTILLESIQATPLGLDFMSKLKESVMSLLTL